MAQNGLGAGDAVLKTLIWLNVGLRALMEIGVVAGFAVWGYGVGSNAWSSLVLALAVPAVVFGIWGLIDFRSAGSGAELLRLAEELLISVWPPWHSIARAPFARWALTGLTVLHHTLVYLTGRRLLA